MSQELYDAIQRHRAQHEAESVAVEKASGFTRSAKSLPCPYCGRDCAVRIFSTKSAEGGFVRYDPPWVEEAASCGFCEIVAFHRMTHQQGTKR